MTFTNDLRAKLAQAGLRLIAQRIAIAKLLFAEGHRHVTAEMLIAETRDMPIPPSLATIYNVLNNFVDAGLIREVALFGSTSWFDTRTDPHFHFYLEAQNKLFDIPDELVPLFEIRAPEGTTITGIDVVIKLKTA